MQTVEIMAQHAWKHALECVVYGGLMILGAGLVIGACVALYKLGKDILY